MTPADKFLDNLTNSPPFKNLNLKFEEVASEVTKTSQSFDSGMGLDTTTSSLVESEQSIRNAGNLMSSLFTGITSAALSVFAKQYTQGFQYVTDPALKAAGTVMGGYYEIIARSMADQERLAQEYRLVALQSAMSITSMAVPFALRGLASLAVRRGTFASGSFLARAALGAAGRQAAVGIAGSLGAAATFATSGVGAVISAALLAWTVFQLFNEHSKNKQYFRMAQNQALSELFNPKGLMALYQQNAFQLGDEHSRGRMGGMELLVGTSWEDDLFKGWPPASPTSLTNRIYNAAFSGSYSENAVAFDVRKFGFKNEQILDISGNLSRNLQTRDNDNLTAQILMTSGIYAGGNTETMERIVTQIVRSGGFTDKDVNQATEKFEEFFAAVVGDGRPQAAHLELVSALSTFSYDYAMGVRANLGATSEIAKIQQFMGDGGEINGRFDVTATKVAIQSIDDILLKGATMQDLNAVNFVSSLGISRGDAIRGVTHDANTFDKFLGGMQSFLSVSNEDIKNQTEKFQIGLQNFALMNNLNLQSVNVLSVALGRYAEGHGIESIRTEYLENLRDDVAEKLTPYTSFSDSYERAYKTLQTVGNIVYSNNKLYDAVNLNLESVLKFNDIMFDVLEKGFGRAIPDFLEAFQTLLSIRGLEETILLSAQTELTENLNLDTLTEGSTSESERAELVRRDVLRGFPGQEVPGAYGRPFTVYEYMNTLTDEEADLFWQIVQDNDLGDTIDENFVEKFNEILGISTTEEDKEEVFQGTTQPRETTVGSESSRQTLETYFDNIYGTGLSVTLRLLDTYEAGGDYNALLNYSNREGGTFSNVRVTEMTLDEVLRFTARRGRGSYHAWSVVNMPKNTEAFRQGLGSTPVGRYQFVGTTLADVAERGKFDRSRLFDRQLQDEMFIWYAKSVIAGKSLESQISSLKRIWEGLQKAPTDDLIRMIRELQSLATGGMAFPSSNSSLSSLNTNQMKPRNMHISIPISSRNPQQTASSFSESMSNLLRM